MRRNLAYFPWSTVLRRLLSAVDQVLFLLFPRGHPAPSLPRPRAFLGVPLALTPALGHCTLLAA